MATKITIKNDHPADQSGHSVLIKQSYKDNAGNNSDVHQQDQLNPGEEKTIYVHSTLGFAVEEGPYVTYVPPAPVAEETAAAEGAVEEAKTECCDAPAECTKSAE